MGFSFKKILWGVVLLWITSSTTHAGILSMGALSDVTGTRAKVSYYEELGIGLQSIGFQFDLYSYSDTRIYNQIALRHINLENNLMFYRAATLEKNHHWVRTQCQQLLLPNTTFF
jgi:hypothetical protein